MNQEQTGRTQIKDIHYIAFSDRGYRLAQEMASDLGGQAVRSGQPMNVHEWTAEHFPEAEALVYVGAAGIAVRAIAPFVKDKTTDPAVVVIDERALHVIPILSGHLGGANDLARRIAGSTGSDCVITTGTDVNGLFAVDEWSKRQNCKLLEKEKIQNISGALLAGERVSLYCPWPIEGEVPEGIDRIPLGTQPYVYDADEGHVLGTGKIDISLDIEVVGRHPLHLVPQICVLGVGCRRGASAEAIEDRLFDVLENTCVHPTAICAVATIDLKKDEPGLLEFCKSHGWPLMVYSSEELAEVKGDFTASAFVSTITGVDNVCERSAVRAAEELDGLAGSTEADGVADRMPGSTDEDASETNEDAPVLLQKKLSGNGVTMAMACRVYRPDWNWQAQ